MPSPSSLANAIGTTYFARMECKPQGAQRILRRIDVPGQHGIALRKEVKQPREFPGTSIVYVPTTSYVADNAAITRQLYDSFVGEMSTLSLQGVDYPDIMILSVEVRPHIPMVDGYDVMQPNSSLMDGHVYEVTADWIFIYAGVVIP
jgi:hypothetical protein